MGASTRDEIVGVFDALDADLDRMDELSFDVLTTPEGLCALEHLERVGRRLRSPQHALINQVDAQASQQELGGTLRGALADRLRITKAEAGRRIDEAADLGERRIVAVPCFDGHLIGGVLPDVEDIKSPGVVGGQSVFATQPLTARSRARWSAWLA